MSVKVNLQAQVMEDKIKGEIIPAVKDKLMSLIGELIDVEVNFSSIKQFSNNYENSLEHLQVWDGFFILGHLLDVIEFLLQREDYENIRTSFAQKVKKITVAAKPFLKEELVNETLFVADGLDYQRCDEEYSVISDINSTTLTLIDGNLQIAVVFDEGPSLMGDVGSNSFMLKLGSLLGINREYYQEFITRSISISQNSIKGEMLLPSYDLKIEVDWESFEKAGNVDLCLSNFCSLECSYSILSLISAFRLVTHEHGLEANEIADAVDTIVFRNSEDDRKPKPPDSGFCYICKKTLYIYGVYRYHIGHVSPKEISKAIGIACKFEMMRKKFVKLEQITNQEQDDLIELMKDLTNYAALNFKTVDPLLEIISNSESFYQLKEEEKQNCIESINQYWADYEKSEGIQAKKAEEFKYGWTVNKINHRGQFQERLLCLTDQAIYTFAYNSKKKESSYKRARRFPYTMFSTIFYGQFNTEEGRHGIFLKSNIKTQKKEKETEIAISKILKKNLFKLSKFMVFEHLIKKIDRVQDPKVWLPGVKAFEKPSSVCRIASRCFFMKNFTEKKIDLGFGETNFASAFEIIAEMFETLDEPNIECPNFSSMTLTNIILKIFEYISSHVDELDMVIPLDISIPSLLMLIEKTLIELPNRNERMSMDVGFIPPLTFKELIHSLKQCIISFKKKDVENVTISSQHNVVFNIPKILQELEKLEGIPDVEFPTYPRLGLLFIIRFAVTQINKHLPNLPEVNVYSLKIPGIDLPPSNLKSTNNNDSASLMKMFSSDRNRKELMAECVDSRGYARWLSVQVSYIIWACCSSFSRPHNKPQPVRLDKMEIPKSFLGSVYNKYAGNDD